MDDISVRVDWWRNRATFEYDLGSEIHPQMATRIQQDIIEVEDWRRPRGLFGYLLHRVMVWRGAGAR